MAQAKVRDSQRSKLYGAEQAVRSHPKNTDLTNIHELRAYVQHIFDSQWFKNYRPPVIDPNNVQYNYGESNGKYRMVPIIPAQYQVKDGRGRWRNAGGCRSFMTIPRHMRSKFVVLHELAHGIQTERPAHGRQFARILLDLVRRWMGTEAHDILRKSFREKGVKYSKVRKPGKYVDNSIYLRKWREQQNAAKGAENGA